MTIKNQTVEAVGAGTLYPNLKEEDIIKQQKLYPNISRDVAITYALGNNKSTVTNSNISTGSQLPIKNDPNNVREETAGSIDRPIFDFAGLQDRPDSTPYQTKTYDEIQEQERKKAQSMIDATDALFQANIAAIQQAGKESLAGTSSIATSAGLAGSPFKQAAEKKDIAVTERKLAEERARRALEVSKMMNLYDEQAEKKYKEERQFGIEQAEREKLLKEEKQNNSRSVLGEFINQGGNLNDMSSLQKEYFRERTGFDDFELQVFANANKPKEEQPEIKYQTVGNKIVGYYTELDNKGKPQIRTIESEKLLPDIQANVEYTTMMADDGTMLLIPKTFNPNIPTKDQIVQYGEGGQFGEKIDPLESLKKKAEIDKIYNDIAISLGKAKEIDEKIPTVKKINGVDSQWDEETKKWKPISTETTEALKEQLKINIGNTTDIYNLITNIENSKAFESRFGPVGSNLLNFAGIPAAVNYMSGEYGNLEADIDRLISILTLENMPLMKGVLSDSDIIILKQVATNLKEVKTEEKAKEELTRLKNKITEKLSTAQEKLNKGDVVDLMENHNIPIADLPPLKANYNTIDDLVKENPEYNDFIIKITQDALDSGENPTEQDILDLVLELGLNSGGKSQSFINVPSTTEKGLEKIGSLSEKFESGGNAGAIGYDNTGGYSYGTFQMAYNNAEKFINTSKYKDLFTDKQFNSPEWQETWKNLALKNPEDFKQEQKKYIQQTHYDPQIEKLSKFGVNIDRLTRAIKEVIWSTAVQHGGNTDVITKVLSKVGKGASEQEIINEIYNERKKRFGSSDEKTRKSVINRLTKEKQIALNMLS